MLRDTSGKILRTQFKILLSTIVLVCLNVLVTSQTAFAADDYELVAKWGRNGGDGTDGNGDGEFDYPTGVAVDSSDNVYIAESSNNRVQKFNSSGTFITKWGKNGGYPIGGSRDGEFDHAMGVATDSNGDVYVADTSNHRIQKFDSDGTFLFKHGKRGIDNGEFDYPFGVAVDSKGNVYVADTDNHRIQKLNSSGTFITRWGRNSGDGTDGIGDGEFDSPFGVAVDSKGNVYVSDQHNERIQKFNSSGTFITKWGKKDGTGSASDEDSFIPSGIAVDSSGNVYVACIWNNRIHKFKRTDTSYVAADKAWLTFDQIKSSNTFETAITSNLNLMTIAPSGSTVYWVSNNESVIGTDGTVSHPAHGASDASVTLIATLTKGSAADTKTFNLSVKASTGTPSTTPTTSFSDVPDTAWYKTYVDTLVSKGVISGFPDDAFRPDNPVTRAEFSKMLCLAMGWTTTSTATSSFKDVSLTDWYSLYIEAAKTNGALSGYLDGIFAPEKTITRAEIAAAIARVKGLSSEVATFTDTKGHWANGQIGACANTGILSGYPGGFFKPDGAATRAEAAKLIAALL